MRGRRADSGALASCDWPVPFRKYSRRGGSPAPENVTARISMPTGIAGAGEGARAFKASMRSRHTGAAPLVPETALILSPSRLPIQTATV